VLLDIQAGRGKDAAARMDQVLTRTAPDATMLMLAAKAHTAAGNPDKAEALLKKAIDIEPDRMKAYGLLGQFYVSQRRLPDAREQYTTIVAKNPTAVGPNTMLAMIMEAQGDKPAAEAQYWKTLSLDANAAVAANNLAWLWVSTGRNLDQALQLAQTAAKVLPDSPQVLDTLGWAFYQKNMNPQAIQQLEASVRKDATDPSVHYHLGMAYSKIGDFDKAKASLQKALTMNPRFDGADEARKTLEGLGKG